MVSKPTRRRILIVDDEERNRELLREMVQAMWHDCDTAYDGPDALAKIDSTFDVVLLDVMMPKMDGFEVAQRIRARTDVKDVAIIMVTGVATRELRRRAAAVGISSLIAKPAHWTELRVAIEMAGAGSMASADAPR